jgi:hypothetical protein
MYKNNFVVAVKSEGNVLREVDDKVYMPFGSEYTIFLKNLDSRKASVSVEIDGEDVLDSNRLIINSHNDLELEGFMSGNRAEYGFKFIERTKAIENHRGIKAEDGIIRLEVKFEKPAPKYNVAYPSWPYYPTYYPTYFANSSWNDSSAPVYCSSSTRGIDGITVKGNDVDQKFNYTSFGNYDSDVTVLCLRLFGTREEPIFVKTRLVCSSCGKSHSSNQKFCSECGTRLL